MKKIIFILVTFFVLPTILCAQTKYTINDNDTIHSFHYSGFYRISESLVKREHSPETKILSQVGDSYQATTDKKIAWEIIIALAITLCSGLFYMMRSDIFDSLYFTATVLFITKVIGIFVSFILAISLTPPASIVFVMTLQVFFVSAMLSLLAFILFFNSNKEGAFSVMVLPQVAVAVLVVYHNPELWAWALNGFIFLFVWLIFKIPSYTKKIFCIRLSQKINSLILKEQI